MPPTNGLYTYKYMTPNTNFVATKTPHPLGPCRCCWTAITWSPLKTLFSNEDFFPLVLPRKKTCTKLVGDFKFPFEKYAPQKLDHFPKVSGWRKHECPENFSFFLKKHRTLGLVDLQGFWANCFASETSWCLAMMNHSFTLFRPNKKSALKWIRLTWTLTFHRHFIKVEGKIIVFLLKLHVIWVGAFLLIPVPLISSSPKNLLIHLASLKSFQPLSSKNSFTASPILHSKLDVRQKKVATSAKVEKSCDIWKKQVMKIHLVRGFKMGIFPK